MPAGGGFPINAIKIQALALERGDAGTGPDKARNDLNASNEDNWPCVLLVAELSPGIEEKGISPA